MYNLMKKELRDVKRQFATPRLSSLEDTAKVIEIDTASLIAEEDTYVSVTRLAISSVLALVLSQLQR